MGRATLLLPPGFEHRCIMPLMSNGNEDASSADERDGLGTKAVSELSDAGPRRVGGPIRV